MASAQLLQTEHEFTHATDPLLHIEVWSDVVCPFCYVGKRRFESALAGLPEGTEVRVEWKSFELDPNRVTRSDMAVNELLAKDKGWSIEQVNSVTERVVEMAAGEGLQYAMDRAVWANTHRAHVLLHWAKLNGKQHVMKERLFAAYFCEGENIDDEETLVRLAVEVGLPERNTREAMGNSDLANDVQNDQYEARMVGVRGVPFFLINGETSVSGAQPVKVFQDALAQALSKQRVTLPHDGPVCDPQTGCE